MDGLEMMSRLAAVIDGHDWEHLPSLLHERFECRYVHTGEKLGREAWVRLNAEYPGFERFTLREVVADGNRAAARAHVTGRNGDEVQHFEVATFITIEDDLIADMTEVWTDTAGTPPDHRPTS